MRVFNCRCNHCQDIFMYQASGSERVENCSPSMQYCTVCYTTIKEALSHLPAKRFKVSRKIEDVSHLLKVKVDLKLLQKWEAEKEKEDKQNGNLTMKRMFASVYNSARNEHTKQEQVFGRDECKGIIFFYSYWPSNPDECTITMEVEQDAEGKVLGPWVYYKSFVI